MKHIVINNAKRLLGELIAFHERANADALPAKIIMQKKYR